MNWYWFGLLAIAGGAYGLVMSIEMDYRRAKNAGKRKREREAA